MSGFSLGLGLAEATRQFQMEFIRKQIVAAGNNMSEAAKSMGLHRSNLYRKMSQLGMLEGDHSDDADADAGTDDESSAADDDL